MILSCPIFIQCHKDECKSEYLGDLRFTETDLKINPYTGAERLVFRDSIGDSICYNNGIRYSNYGLHIYEHYDPQNPDACWGDYYKTEQNYTFFNEVNYGTISVELDIWDPFKENKKYIVLCISYEKVQNWYFACDFVFDSLQLHDNPKSIYGTARILGYSDSLSIGPNKYYSVYTLIHRDDPNPQKHLKIVYYSLNKGIVGFKTYQEHLWYLSN